MVVGADEKKAPVEELKYAIHTSNLLWQQISTCIWRFHHLCRKLCCFCNAKNAVKISSAVSLPPFSNLTQFDRTVLYACIHTFMQHILEEYKIETFRFPFLAGCKKKEKGDLQLRCKPFVSKKMTDLMFVGIKSDEA